uniref:HNH nuclease domain-containing protein n=1 Tax=viral metagenome TaxID=1070528 RepID=A0A6C0JEZ9_9ZZZZ
MKINFVIFLITVFLMANTYYDGRFTEYLTKGKKYYKIATFGFVGLSIYLFINKHPGESKNLIKHATELIKYMPVDSNTSDMLTPLFDFTNAREKINQMGQSNITPQTRRMMNSGGGRGGVKRCVSETKKKYVAAQQSWKCNMCNEQLSHTFQVDHKIDLQFGGDNSVSNLAALCNNCHADKTAANNL